MIRRNSVSNTVIALVAIVAALHYAQLVWIVICVSILLAFVLEPVVVLAEKIHLPRSLGALIAMLALAALLYGISYGFYTRAVQFSHQIPKYVTEVRDYIARYTERMPATNPGAENQETNQRTIRVVQQPSLWNEIGSSLGTATDVALAASFVPFLTYFMLTWKDHARRSTVLLFPREGRQTAYESVGSIATMIRGFIVGNLLVGIFIGVISTAVFGILGIPYFYFVGFISGFLSLVPYLGVLLAMLPPVLSGLGILHGSGYLFIFLTVLGLHLFSLNVLYPKFLGRRLQLNPLAVTLSLLIWGWIWGAMGLILAIPVTAAMKVVFDHVEPMNAFGEWLGE